VGLKGLHYNEKKHQPFLATFVGERKRQSGHHVDPGKGESHEKRLSRGNGLRSPKQEGKKVNRVNLHRGERGEEKREKSSHPPLICKRESREVKLGGKKREKSYHFASYHDPRKGGKNGERSNPFVGDEKKRLSFHNHDREEHAFRSPLAEEGKGKRAGDLGQNCTRYTRKKKGD